MISSEAASGRLTEAEILADIDAYDFIDIGANKGDSFRMGLELLGGTRGLALDINPDAANKLRNRGIPALHRDCRQFDFGGFKFRFAIMSHILEHLDSRGEVLRLLLGVSQNVSEFVFIRQPFFDADSHLSTLGIKTVGSNLSYHPLHLSSLDYAGMLHAADFRDFAIYGSERLLHSHQSSKIIRSTSPLGTKGWKRDAETKPELVAFDRPIYRELVMVVKMGETDLGPVVDAAVPEREVLFKSRLHFKSLPD